MIGQQEHVCLHLAAASQTQPQDAQRDPRIIGGDRRHDRRRVARALAQLGGATGVELGGHEHRAALGIEIEHFGCVRGQQEPVLQRPPANLVTAALQHRDVQRIDLRFQDHLHGAVRCIIAAALGEHIRRRWRHLLSESLQRPVAAPLHLRRHVGQRDDGTHRLTLPGKLERRHIPLDPTVIRRQRRGPHQLDAAVLPHETTARTNHTNRHQHPHDTSNYTKTPHRKPPLRCRTITRWTTTDTLRFPADFGAAAT